VSERFINLLMDIHAKIEPFLKTCVEDILKHKPHVIGFTSTFQQHVASLCLARRLKQRKPDLFIVLGGANCEGIKDFPRNK